MGLDGVELLMEVEDVFDLDIPDSDYQKFRTVGDVYQYILQQHRIGQSVNPSGSVCPSITAFLAVRRALTTILPSSHCKVRPSSSLAMVIPVLNRRQIWEQLQATTKIKLPSLVLFRIPHEIIRVWLNYAILSLIVMGSAWITWEYGLPAVVLIWILMSVLLLFIWIATRPMALAFPYGCSTVREVVRFAKPPTYPSQNLSLQQLDEEAVWKKLVTVFVEVLALKESQVVPSARLIEDLRVD